ncbi:MAG: hypothetical protein ACOYOT_02340 [Bacteroidales bacterium]
MKRNYRLIICTLALIFVAQLSAKAATLASDTTTIRYNDKLVKIEENKDQIKVKILDAKRPNDTTAYKQLYEGIFSDGKSYETWSVMESMGIKLPNFGKNKSKRHEHSYSMDPHYSGFGIGFANLIDQNDKRSTLIPLKADETTEWFINFIEHSYSIYRNRLALVTGFGINWRTYNLIGDYHLIDINGVTNRVPSPNGEHYNISRLKVTRLTMPLLIEWQPRWIRNSFLSGGVEAGIKTYSSYRVKYTTAQGDKVDKIEAHGLNTNPLSLDVMAKAGIDNISIFAKYGLIGVFSTDKGYDVRPVSIGIMLNF